MTTPSYNELMNDGFRKYKEGKYAEAYELVTRIAPTLSGNPPQVYNFRFCLASIGGKHDLALEIMHEAIMEKGYWYSKEFLDDADLDPIRETESFREVAAICAKREEVAKRNAHPESKIFEPDPRGMDAVLIALHGNGQNNSLSKQDWNQCLRKGYALALLQSSQISFADGFYWNDYEKGASELEDFWTDLNRKLNIERSVVGGFSAGARVALYSILTNRIQPKAFILVGPWIPEIEHWKGLIDRATKNVSGFIVCGDQDEDCYPLAKKASGLLNQGGISTRLLVFPGLDHDFPDNFNQILNQILDSIF